MRGWRVLFLFLVAGPLLALFAYLLAACTSNVCLDFAGFLGCLAANLADAQPPFRFCCSFNQFQLALCTCRLCFRRRVYFWASANPFVYPRTTVAAAAASGAGGGPDPMPLPAASPSKCKYECLEMMPLAHGTTRLQPHTQIHNLLTTFDERYFHLLGSVTKLWQGYFDSRFPTSNKVVLVMLLVLIPDPGYCCCLGRC